MVYGYEPEELERMKQTVLDIFDVFAAICEKYEIPYFVQGGTAIGAVRHRGYIPWDDDIDLGLPRKDFDKLHELLNWRQHMRSLTATMTKTARIILRESPR